MSAIQRVFRASLCIAALFLITTAARATCGTKTNPAPSWGYNQYQIDQYAQTVTLTSEAGFQSPSGSWSTKLTVDGRPNGASCLGTPVTIHEVHGNAQFDVASTSCTNGAIIAELLDQNNNVIA